jgi:hypothetical protein
MKKHIAATVLIAVVSGPASALDVGLGGKVGGIGVGANASIGGGKGKGVDVDVGADVSADGIGGADLDASVDAGRGKGVSANVGAGANVNGVGGVDIDGSLGASRSNGIDADVGVSGNLGDKSGGVSIGGGSGNGTGGGSTTSGGGSGKGGKGGTHTVDLPGGLMPSAPTTASIVLPRGLAPSGGSKGTWGYPLLPKIIKKPGVPDAVVRVCRQAIASAARRLGAVKVQAVSAGLMRGRTAPLVVTINYAKEVRQMPVGCRLNAAGSVVGVS